MCMLGGSLDTGQTIIAGAGHSKAECFKFANVIAHAAVPPISASDVTAVCL